MEASITLEQNNITQDEKKFINFLNERRIKNGKASHTGVGKQTGKFLIEGPQLKIFYQLYSKCMQNNVEISLIEQHTEIGPFIIDIDMRFKIDMKKRVFDYPFVKKLCAAYIKQILEYFDLTDLQKLQYLQAFVFERPQPYEAKNQMKDGLHIMFPFIVSNPAVQTIIRENVIKDLEELFMQIPIENNIYNAIDKLVIEQVGWYMYGSTKPGIPRYNLTNIFDYNLNDVDIKNYDEYQLPSILSIRNKTETTPLKDSKLEEISNFQLKSCQRKVNRKKEVSNLTEEEIEDIYELVSMLKNERADDYNDWINIGFALYSIDQENEDLLAIWDDFSRRSSKYDPKSCDSFWYKMRFRDDGINLGSIHHWAWQDSPDKYKEFRAKQMRSFIEQSVSGTNVDVAKVLYKMYKYTWVCASAKNQKWYMFSQHRWHEDELGIGLRNKISNELVYEYIKFISYLNERIIVLEDELEAGLDKKTKFETENKIKQMEAKIERLTVITKNLKTTNFIDNVMKECRGLFYNKDFIQKLDENHFLFSFKNGIMDLKTGEFRDGRPDDFISLCCGVNYVKYSDTMPYLEDIKDFLAKVHPGENERRYMLSLISSLLEGHNADESFHLWTGTGGNGKSKVNELLIQAFGDYAIKFPITLFTGKRGASNSVSPEVVESKGKRYAYLEEPSEGERINIGLMKEYSGGDKIKGRGLWSNFIEFKPQFKIILFCNDMPKVPADDMGTWRRIKVLEFLSCFVDNPKNPNEFKKDKYLSEKIPKWTETFMSMIVHNYTTDYKVMGGLFIPKEVEKFTEEYQKDMDIYIDFINTRLVKTDKKTDKISLQSLHDDFKSWYMMNYNCQKYPLKKDMKKYFEKKYGKANCSTTHILGFVKNSVYNDDDDD